MKLAQLLEQHRRAGSSAARENFGDALLVKENRLYGAVREKAVKAGYSFSSGRNDFYAALPLSQLGAILENKVIPYQDNVSVLEELEKRNPGMATWNDLRDNLKKNFIFHESCHAVARSRAASLQSSPVLNMLMEESFANTCELLAVVDAENPAHRIFYEWNSYSALFQERTNFKKAMAELGPGILFKFIFLGYLHSNCLYDQWDEAHFKKALALAGAGNSEAKALRSLSRVCFTLDETFKNVTTGFYLKLNGHGPVPKGKHLDIFENDQNYRNYLNLLFEGLI